MTNVAHVLTDAEFAALLEAGPDALVVTDVHGSVLLVNAQTEKLFGYDRKELIGKEVETLIPERYRSLRPILGLRGPTAGAAEAGLRTATVARPDEFGPGTG